jgi:hypothetical protein
MFSSFAFGGLYYWISVVLFFAISLVFVPKWLRGLKDDKNKTMEIVTGTLITLALGFTPYVTSVAVVAIIALYIGVFIYCYSYGLNTKKIVGAYKAKFNS